MLGAGDKLQSFRRWKLGSGHWNLGWSSGLRTVDFGPSVRSLSRRNPFESKNLHGLHN